MAPTCSHQDQVHRQQAAHEGCTPCRKLPLIRLPALRARCLSKAHHSTLHSFPPAPEALAPDAAVLHIPNPNFSIQGDAFTALGCLRHCS
eukprot:scaffold24450_cov22-Tisochrysis_lutea.AAC.4